MEADRRDKRRAIFLDRDGTLNRDVEYLSSFEEFEVLPGILPALHTFQDLGYLLFVVSNQSGVARKLFSYEDVEEFHRRMDASFLSEGIRFEAIVFCPHHPEGVDPRFTKDCDCRKPKPGMILSLAAKYGIDLAASYMIGDKLIDAEAGVGAGATGVWLRIPGGRYSEPDRVDKPENIKEFLSLLDFSEDLREFDGRYAKRSPVPRDPESPAQMDG